MQKEIWASVAGFEGIYSVSTEGRVRSENRRVVHCNGKTVNYRSKILKPTFRKEGYLKVSLMSGGVTTQSSVHRLVAEAFIPNPEGKPEVNHIDNNPANNCVSNLEWCDRIQNARHCVKQGRNYVPSPACLSDQKQEQIKLRYESGESIKVISESMGLNRKTVRKYAKQSN